MQRILNISLFLGLLMMGVFHFAAAESLDTAREVALPLQLTKVFQAKLRERISKTNPEISLGECNAAAYEAIRALNLDERLIIERKSLERASREALTPRERGELAQYIGRFKSGKDLEARTEQLGKGDFVHYAPILLDSPVCLQCHGVIGKDVSSATVASLARSYSRSVVTGRKLGDPLGIWIIRPRERKKK